MAAKRAGIVTGPERERWAQAQDAIVRHLLVGEPKPPEIDAERLRAFAGSLEAKRRRYCRKRAPMLCASLGEDFARQFHSFAQAQPRRSGEQTHDGEEFAKYLQQRGELTDPGRIEWFHRQLLRGLPFRIARLPQSRRLVWGRRARNGRTIVHGAPE